MTYRVRVPPLAGLIHFFPSMLKEVLIVKLLFTDFLP